MLILAVLVAVSGEAAVAATPYRVIAHPQVKGTQIGREALSAIFLKQAARWTDGLPVVPVDQSVKAKIRTTFSFDVLGTDLASVQIYWQRRIANGVTPPPVKTSDEEVLAFVASTPGAIGYVSSSLPLPDSVKEVSITN
jgi:ABC-type phosphate transport system substrate-binding protein